MYVITGATGNTGKVIAESLLAKGQKARAVGRTMERLRPFLEKGAEPFIGSMEDEAALTRAFTGARAVYVMIPPDVSNTNYRAYQDHVSDTLAAAIEKAGVQYAVTLSSIGADKSDKTGPVVGLHNLEQKLNRVSELNVLHLRAGYFMENLLPQIGVIQTFGIVGGPLRADLCLPMVATRDIGTAAAEALLRLDFRGKQTRELLGQRDLSYAEAARVIGQAIGKRGLSYAQLPPTQLKPGLVQMGMSPHVADLLLEMAEALNSGYMVALEPRSAQNTTPTSIERFVAEEFVPRFQWRAAAGS